MTKKRKIVSIVFKCWMFSFRAGGFSCSLDVLHGLRDKYIAIFFSTLKFYSLWSSNPWFRFWIRTDLNPWSRNLCGFSTLIQHLLPPLVGLVIYLFKYWQWRYPQSTSGACQICAFLHIRVLNVNSKHIWLKIWCNRWLKIKGISWRHLKDVDSLSTVLEHNTNSKDGRRIFNP